MAAILLALTLGVGCTGNGNKKASFGHGSRGDDPQDDFGTKEEPAITAKTHMAAGQVAESRGDIANALDQYKQAVKLNPKFTQAWYYLAVLEAQTRQFDESISAWQSYLKLVNDNAAAYANLGFTYDLAGRTGEAESAYKAGIKVDPQNKACRTNYGLLLGKQGRFDEAAAQFATVLPPAQVHYNLASIYEQRGQTSQARDEYKMALTIDPSFRSAQTRLSALDAIPTTKPTASVRD
jgi:tetratricopeptide (TPR) repeat protein